MTPTPSRRHARRRLLPLLLALVAVAVSAAACADDDASTGDAATPPVDAAADTPADTPAADAGAHAAAPADRPATRTDTIHLEGMPEPIQLTLYRAPAGFPLPFSTYVPEEVAAESPADAAAAAGADGEAGATVRFVAEFGGRRNEDAFVHVYVFPPGTDRNAAVGQARGYKASRGIPVSQGLEPLSGDEATRRMPWALEAYAFRYQDGGAWYFGAIGVGEHRGRFFQIVRHYPAEYAEGFGPRATLLTRSWRWADGSPLGPAAD